MTRPPFWFNHAQWLRTPRTGQSPAERACAIELYTTDSGVSDTMRWLVGGILIVLALLALVHVYFGA